jgi:hypothetical protein
MRKVVGVLVAVMTIAIITSFHLYLDGEVPYPEGYRSWNHIK